MNKHAGVPWPVPPEIPDGMGVKKRYDDTLTAAVDAEDRVEAAEKAFDEAAREASKHEQASSLPPEEWTAKAQELEAARWSAERYLGMVCGRRDQAWQDFRSADIALGQQAVHTRCRTSNEHLLDVARKAEALEAALRNLNEAVPDKSMFSTQRDALIRLLSSILMRATGFAASPVPSIEAREFAANQIVTPTDRMMQRVVEATDARLQDHWVRSRKTDPDRYRAERKRRKLGGKGGLAKDEEDPT
jgi:hypothetical protein